MLLRRTARPAPRTRTLAVGGALAALAVVGGGTVVAVSGPSEVAAGDIQLVQNTAEQDAAQEMELGTPVDLDLEPVVARAGGGTIPEGTTMKVTGLPDGLVQNGWVISGTPTRAGEYDVLVTVSNDGVSKSEKVAITVTDEPDAAAATANDDEAGTAETAEDESDATAAATTTPTAATEDEAEATTATEAEAEEGTDADDSTTSPAAPATTTTTQPEPTLSAAPGTADNDDDDEAGAEAGTETSTEGAAETDEGTAPEECAIGADGEMDSSSLASGITPLLEGDGEQAPAGLAMVLVGAITNLMPALLGESGSAADADSVGQILCTIQPALLGSGEDAAAGGGGEDASETAEGNGAGAAAGGQTAALAGMTGAPAALLGLLGTGAGSLGG